MRSSSTTTALAFLLVGCTARTPPSLDQVRQTSAHHLGCDHVVVSWPDVYRGSWIAFGCDELHVCHEGSPRIRCVKARAHQEQVAILADTRRVCQRVARHLPPRSGRIDTRRMAKHSALIPPILTDALHISACYRDRPRCQQEVRRAYASSLWRQLALDFAAPDLQGLSRVCDMERLIRLLRPQVPGCSPRVLSFFLHECGQINSICPLNAALPPPARSARWQR